MGLPFRRAVPCQQRVLVLYDTKLRMLARTLREPNGPLFLPTSLLSSAASTTP